MNLIEEMEQYATQNNIPIMQKEGIEFFKQLVQDENIETILEIGTAIGYSAIQLASMSPSIQVTSIERDEERYALAINYVANSEYQNQIKLILGDALEETIQGEYDCIFIDAAKAQYIKFFEKFSPHLKKGGIIVSDNLQFHGYVAHPELASTRNLRQLVKKIQGYIDYLGNNVEYETKFLELGDGIAISRKKQ